jgi:hypothetical protein
MEESKTESKVTYKKSKLIKWIIGIVIVYFILNWGSVYRLFAPPVPVIVSHGVENVSNQLLSYDAGVWANVRNDGGDGMIGMKVSFTQDGQTYTKSTTRYFKSLETSKMEIVFTEAKILGGDQALHYTVFPYGK